MSDTTGYKKHTEYRFEVCGEEISVSSLMDGPHLYVEEVRKNSQEDAHMHGELVLLNMKWIWNPDFDGQSFKFYHGEELYEAIPAYLNEHPHPEMKQPADAPTSV